MAPHRLFIGGLTPAVDDESLRACMSPFGFVTDVHIKKKMGLDGEIISCFGFINIDAEKSKIQECISALNGTSWKGMHLKVDLAKESFLDRLARENKDRSFSSQAVCSGGDFGSCNVTLKEIKEKQSNSPTNQKTKDSPSKSLKNVGDSSDVHRKSTTNFANDSHGNSEKSPRLKKKKLKLSKNEVEEREVNKSEAFGIVSGGDKESSSAIFHLDSLNETSDTNNYKVIPSLSQGKTAEAIDFQSGYGGFSFLQMFPVEKQEESSEEEVEGYFEKAKERSESNESEVDAELYGSYPHSPEQLALHENDDDCRPFFINSNDALLTDAVDWLIQPLDEDGLEKFNTARNNLLSEHKQAIAARRDLKKINRSQNISFSKQHKKHRE